jgi:hypothetical protein
MKSLSASEWVKTSDHIHQELTAKGFKPTLQTLDNEASAALKHFFTANDVEYQLVPPHCQHRNAPERATRTFKEHFVAGLASFDPTFPLHLWDRLLPQAEITLNILRTSRLHPQLSAAAHFHGLVDYNKTAFAPPGCKIIANKRPGKCRTWAPHGQHEYSLAQLCITTGVKMSTSRPLLANASWTHSSFSLIIIRCHSYPPQTDCSLRPMTCQTHFNTRIRRYHSLTSEMTPSLRSQHWRTFSNSNLTKFPFPWFQILLPISLYEHAPPNHPIQS